MEFLTPVRIRILSLLVLIEPAVADEGGEGGSSSDVISGEAIEEAEAQHIGSEKPPPRPE
jgi:hypothetical protein